MITLESIFSTDNLKIAVSQVMQKKGAPGIDGLTTLDIIPWIKAHPHKLTNEIMNESYRFTPSDEFTFLKRMANFAHLGSLLLLTELCNRH